MNKRKSILAGALLAVVASGCVSVKETEIFGQRVAIVKTRDLVAPCTTTVLDEDLRPINRASCAGLIPSVATGTGIAAGGYFIGRQHNHGSDTDVSVGGDKVTANGGTGNGGNNSNTGGPGFVPPGHQSNPSQNH